MAWQTPGSQGTNYVEITTNLGSIAAGFTLCAHIKPPSSTFDGQILGLQTSYSGTRLGWIACNASNFYGGHSATGYGKGAGDPGGVGTPFAPDGTNFYFVAITYDGTTFSAYAYNTNASSLVTLYATTISNSYFPSPPDLIAAGYVTSWNSWGIRNYAIQNCEVATMRYFPGVCLNTTQLLAERTSLIPVASGATMNFELNNNLTDSVNSYSLTQSGGSLNTDEPGYFTAPSPTITNVSPSSFLNGQTGITITGTTFDASKGAGYVTISNSNSNPLASGYVTQTTTAWGSTGITFTASQGALALNTTYYLYVTNNEGSYNATGYSVMFSAPQCGQQIYIMP